MSVAEHIAAESGPAEKPASFGSFARSIAEAVIATRRGSNFQLGARRLLIEVGTASEEAVL